MTNHVHLLVTSMTEHGITHLMQDLGRKFVRYINHTYRRSGTLWEGRYKASLIDSEIYLLTCMRYIELNPVRASMVSHPGDYRWTSYHSNAHGKPDPLLSPHPLYTRLSTDAEGRLQAYRELFRHHIDNDLLYAIRKALNQELVLGREDFKDKIERMIVQQTRPARSGMPKLERADESMGDYYVF
jgi:putative transposase